MQPPSLPRRLLHFVIGPPVPAMRDPPAPQPLLHSVWTAADSLAILPPMGSSGLLLPGVSELGAGGEAGQLTFLLLKRDREALKKLEERNRRGDSDPGLPAVSPSILECSSVFPSIQFIPAFHHSLFRPFIDLAAQLLSPLLSIPREAPAGRMQTRRSGIVSRSNGSCGALAECR